MRRNRASIISAATSRQAWQGTPVCKAAAKRVGGREVDRSQPCVLLVHVVRQLALPLLPAQQGCRPLRRSRRRRQEVEQAPMLRQPLLLAAWIWVSGHASQDVPAAERMDM